MSQVPIFLALTILGLVILVGGAFFGHDHDHEVHFDHDHDHGGDGHSGEPSVSVFSLKVVGAFIMAFGAGGALASMSEMRWIASTFIGTVSGVSLGAVMYGVLRIMYSQQSNSLVSTAQAIGKNGVVTVEVGETSLGSVDLMLAGESRNYFARSSAGKKILKGRAVKVVSTIGSEVLVEEVS